MSPTLCISCAEPMAPGTERPPSMGNPNQCVPCACGIERPAQDGLRKGHGRPNNLLAPSATASMPQSRRQTAESESAIHLPPATAPGIHPPRDAGTATTAAGGNPFPRGRWS